MSSRKWKITAAAIANDDDLLTEILILLPIKSLLKCKSVPKRWLSLISSPQFSSRLKFDPNSVSGLILQRPCFFSPKHDFVPLTDKTTIPPFKYLPYDYPTSSLRILHSCRGLLLCSSFHGHEHYIYNPTTKQYVTIPQRGGQIYRIVYGFNLAYDPAKSPHYKIVCVRQPDSSEDSADDDYAKYHQIEIYSSETRSWRLSGDPFTPNINVHFNNGVFSNGAIHWLNCYDGALYFNLDEEQVRDMPMPSTPIPDDWEDGRRFRYFGESREHLRIVEIYGRCTTNFDVYEMEKDYSGWFVKYHLDLQAVTVAFPEMIRSYLDPSDLHYYKFAIIGIIREANDEESYMVLHTPGKAIRYNFIDKTFNKICDISPGDDCEDHSLKFAWFDADKYIETLARI